MALTISTVTNIGRNGLADWILQRVSGVIIAAYVIFLVLYFIVNQDVTYEQWRYLFTLTWVKILTLLTLLSLVAHAWIGIWTVVTDYIKCAALRFTVQVTTILALLLQLFWGVTIFWGV